MSEKILILGGAGMLGWQMVKLFYKKKQITVTVSSFNSAKILKKKIGKKLKIIKFDFEKNYEQKLKKIILKHDIVINCVGLIKPYINDSNPNDIKKAFKLNFELPNSLYEITKDTNIKVYQIATDCVFSGNSSGYDETSKHDCEDVYGKTKSLGEINSKNYFNLRCSIIGEEIKNFRSLIGWFNSNKKGSLLNGFSNHEWNGLTTNAFARIIEGVINFKISLPNKIHIVPKNKISKYKLLKLLNIKYDKKFKIRKFKSDYSINRSLKTINSKINNLIWKKTHYKGIPTIEKMISEL